MRIFLTTSSKGGSKVEGLAAGENRRDILETLSRAGYEVEKLRPADGLYHFLPKEAFGFRVEGRNN